MKLRIAVALIVVAMLITFVGTQRSSVERPNDVRSASDRPASTTGHETSAVRTNVSAVQSWDAPPARAAASGTAAARLPPAVPDAALSLADAMHDGDPRTPPIERDETADESPTVNELADPAAYRRYEARRQARVHRAFEREASIALVDQRRDLDRARAEGAPPEVLAEGEEKAHKLAETLRRLREGEFDTAREPASKK